MRRRTTEDPNPRSAGLDRLDTRAIVGLMNTEDATVIAAVEAALDPIAAAADLAAAALERGGRVLYLGSGTSGRIAAADAAELPPTFGLEEGRVVAVLAGGDAALGQAVEGAEDDALEAVATMRDMHVGADDCIIGVTASGTTRFVLGGLGEARERGAATVLVTSGRAPAPGFWSAAIVLDTGPEIILGSTRLKAGTAAKLVLNMISTAAMVRLGRVYDNLMVEMPPSNDKLRRRAVRVVAYAARLGATEARMVLERCGGEVKTAIVVAKLAVEPDEARERLAAHGGNVRTVLETAD